jgi:hypothetical protein
MGRRTNTVLQTCFFALSGVLPQDEAIAQIKKAIQKTYGRKGEQIVKMNYAAVDAALAGLQELRCPRRGCRGAATAAAELRRRSRLRAARSPPACSPTRAI